MKFILSTRMMTWPLSVPVLTDGVVTLRAHTPTDVSAMLETATDPEMVRWTAVPTPYGPNEATRFLGDVVQAGWDAGTHLMWAIEVTGNDGRPQFAGQALGMDPHHRRQLTARQILGQRLEGAREGIEAFQLEPRAHCTRSSHESCHVTLRSSTFWSPRM